MRHPPLLIALLILASILVDVVLATVGLDGDAVVVVLYPLATSQVNLVAAWVAFGTRPLPLRLVGIILAVGFWSATGGLAFGEGSGAGIASHMIRWGTGMLVQGSVLLAALSIVRAAGVTLVERTASQTLEETTRGSLRPQFSLRHLFGWMTATAVVLGVTKYTIDRESMTGAEVWPELALWSVGHGAIASAALWATLGKRLLFHRIFVVCLTAGLAAWADSRWTEFHGWWHSALICLVQVLWLAGSLAVVRVAGYRLARGTPPPANPLELEDAALLEEAAQPRENAP